MKKLLTIDEQVDQYIDALESGDFSEYEDIDLSMPHGKVVRMSSDSYCDYYEYEDGYIDYYYHCD